MKEKLEYLCTYGMKFFRQEEAYTSQASFFDGDAVLNIMLIIPKNINVGINTSSVACIKKRLANECRC